MPSILRDAAKDMRHALGVIHIFWNLETEAEDGAPLGGDRRS